MDNTKSVYTKKILHVVAALIVGFLMPYLSRIPLAFTYGANWIWSYMPNHDSFVVWNKLHFFSLEPIFMFGLIYIFGNVKWQFYAASLAHFAVTFLCYYNFEETPQRDDVLAIVVFPFFIGAPSFVCGLIGLVAEIVMQRRKQKEIVEKKVEFERF